MKHLLDSIIGIEEPAHRAEKGMLGLGSLIPQEGWVAQQDGKREEKEKRLHTEHAAAT